MPMQSAVSKVSLQATRLVAGCLTLAVTTAALAQPPAGVGPGRGDSRTERALESRARVLDRAGEATRPGLSGAASGFSSSGAAGGGAEVGLGARARLGIERGGVERGVTARSDAGRGSMPQEIGGTGDTRTQERGNSGFRFGWLFGGGRQDTPQQAAAGQANRPTAPFEADRPAAGNAMAENRGQARSGNASDRPATSQRLTASERTLGLADTQLARRLAQIDQMRDQALATGNENLLVQADQLETLARAQFTQRTTDERTVGTAMRTFNQQRQSADIPGEPVPVNPISPEQPVLVELEPIAPTVESESETSLR